jgi:hypothetical protein
MRFAACGWESRFHERGMRVLLASAFAARQEGIQPSN